ncbi:MAG: hypothetical protein PHW60_02580 [Kiritimatiellae bacterium]|nr:hypothetical protein [Kiritimatiellia bacterium]
MYNTKWVGKLLLVAGVLMIVSSPSMAKSPDHYGFYLVSKEGQQELISIKDLGNANEDEMTSKMVFANDPNANLVLYHPDIKPTKLAVMDADNRPVEMMVKPLGQDLYSLTPRQPFGANQHYAVMYNQGSDLMPKQVAWCFYIGKKSNMRKLTDTQTQGSCINNLRCIESAKDEFATAMGKTKGWAWASDTEAFSNLVGGKFLSGFPVCAAGSNLTNVTAAGSACDYKINPIGSNAICNVHGNHRIPTSAQ